MIVRPGPEVQLTERLATAFHDYPLDEALVACVLPVHRAGAAAVISYEGALCPLHVDDDGAAILEMIGDVVPAVAGGELAAIAPAARGQACAYLQSRRLIRYDLAQRSRQLVRLVRGDQAAIAAIWLSDQEDRIAVQVEDTGRYDEGGLVLHRLDVFTVGEAGGARVASVPLPRERAPGRGWAAGAGLVAIAGPDGLAVSDGSLQPLRDHPLARAARLALDEASAREIHDLRIHPREPLAVLVACTRDVFGLRDFTVWRATWDAAGPVVRRLAQVHAIGDLALGSFAPGLDAIDLRVVVGDVVRPLLAVRGATLFDLGPSRGLQGAGWSGPPLRYLAFERAAAKVVVWTFPELDA